MRITSVFVRKYNVMSTDMHSVQWRGTTLTPAGKIVEMPGSEPNCLPFQIPVKGENRIRIKLPLGNVLSNVHKI
jgi:hypothetical protein